MRYLSLFSGIEAASVAWRSLGWVCVGVAEIEPFPSAVLAHHYPDVPNLGDVCASDFIERAASLLPDIIVGGSPCQSFSVAGLRASLSDSRGELSLRYIKIIEAIDAARARAGLPAVIVVYENVPGLLSTKDNAFGCFLGALAGEDDELQPPGGKWSNAGVVLGSQRTIAWRILDAQYFGVAQRRRRVFLVASARKDVHPAQILFEWEGVRRDIAPSREQGQKTTDSTASSSKQRSHWDGEQYPHPTVNQAHNTGGIGQSNQELFSQRGAGLVQTFDRQSSGEYGTAPVASTVSARDYKSATDLVMSVHGTQDPCVSEEMAFALGRNSGQENAIAYGLPGNCVGREPKNGGNAVASMIDVHGVAVRRLTPVECERLQGFPDGYTQIPWRGKPADECPDGNRYKALGNSMVVPCMEFIGRQIKKTNEEGILTQLKYYPVKIDGEINNA